MASVGPAVDLDEVRALFVEYHAGVGRPACFAGFEQELAELPGDYRPPGGALLLARVDGSPAGCAALRAIGERAGEMKRLYVRPAFRGHGLARQLTSAIIDACRTAGHRVLYLDTLPTMTAAIALYGAFGFSPRGAYSAAPTPGALFFERWL